MKGYKYNKKIKYYYCSKCMRQIAKDKDDFYYFSVVINGKMEYFIHSLKGKKIKLCCVCQHDMYLTENNIKHHSSQFKPNVYFVKLKKS